MAKARKTAADSGQRKLEGNLLGSFDIDLIEGRQLDSTLWLEKRKPHWQRLEQLLDQSARKGIRYPRPQRTARTWPACIGKLAADLAALREDPASVTPSHRYLNQLAHAAGHTNYLNIIYSPEE
jgi:hypothetical protein